MKLIIENILVAVKEYIGYMGREYSQTRSLALTSDLVLLGTIFFEENPRTESF